MPDGGVGGQDADDEGRQAHDQDGDQEGVFAADHVAEAAEQDGAERTNNEPAVNASSAKMKRANRLQIGR